MSVATFSGAPILEEMGRAVNCQFLRLMQKAGVLVLLVVVNLEVCEHRLYVAVHVAVFDSDLREDTESWPAATSKRPYARRRSFIEVRSVFWSATFRLNAGPCWLARKSPTTLVSPLPMNFPRSVKSAAP